jgi:hypothetical protein
MSSIKVFQTCASWLIHNTTQAPKIVRQLTIRTGIHIVDKRGNRAFDRLAQNNLKRVPYTVPHTCHAEQSDPFASSQPNQNVGLAADQSALLCSKVNTRTLLVQCVDLPRWLKLFRHG